MADRDEATYVQLKFRVREHLRAKLEEDARLRGVSLNAEIVRRLTESFDKQPAFDREMTAGVLLEAVDMLERPRERFFKSADLAEATAVMSVEKLLLRIVRVLSATGSLADVIKEADK